MHFSYRVNVINSSDNFFSSSTHDPLFDDSKITVTQHQLLAEYQPNRLLSMGALLSSDQVDIENNTGIASESGLGDQRVFVEYRLVDEIGYSLGMASILKFPLYSNPDPVTSTNPTAALGDAQTDFTVMGTGEKWFTNSIRTRVNLGLTFRTEGFATEIPFLVSVGFVTHRLDLDLKISGNFSLGNDDFDSAQATIKGNFGASDYIFAENPMIVNLHPTIDFWITPKWGLNFEFKYSLMGERAPLFTQVTGGLSYRWAKINGKVKRSFKEVDIGTDQNKGLFDQEGNYQPSPSYPNPVSDDPDYN